MPVRIAGARSAEQSAVSRNVKSTTKLAYNRALTFETRTDMSTQPFSRGKMRGVRMPVRIAGARSAEQSAVSRNVKSTTKLAYNRALTFETRTDMSTQPFSRGKMRGVRMPVRIAGARSAEQCSITQL